MYRAARCQQDIVDGHGGFWSVYGRADGHCGGDQFAVRAGVRWVLPDAEVLDADADAFGDVEQVLFVSHIGDDDSELLAAPSAAGVFWACLRFKFCRHSRKYPVRRGCPN